MSHRLRNGRSHTYVPRYFMITPRFINCIFRGHPRTKDTCFPRDNLLYFSNPKIKFPGPCVHSFPDASLRAELKILKAKADHIRGTDDELWPQKQKKLG